MGNLCSKSRHGEYQIGDLITDLEPQVGIPVENYTIIYPYNEIRVTL